MHAEDVDLIRVDKRVAEILKSDRELSQKIVSKFHYLPNRIAALSRERLNQD
jgi:hypothetical protein